MCGFNTEALNVIPNGEPNLCFSNDMLLKGLKNLCTFNPGSISLQVAGYIFSLVSINAD